MPLKKTISSIFVSLILWSAGTAQNDYQYKIDLVKLVDDKVMIEVTPPKTDANEVRFCFPAMVPGTYEIYNFGRFVSDLKVTGKNGVKIKVDKQNDNVYVLSPAKDVEKITYMVEDSWDTKIKEKVVFEPAGTNIDEGKIFDVNTHGFFGFYDGMLDRNFILEFNKPA